MSVDQGGTLQPPADPGVAIRVVFDVGSVYRTAQDAHAAAQALLDGLQAAGWQVFGSPEAMLTLVLAPRRNQGVSSQLEQPGEQRVYSSSHGYQDVPMPTPRTSSTPFVPGG